MKDRAYIVLGLGYGDEGKGLTSDFLCLNSPNPIVIRFNGGQQAGHTVVTQEGKRHVFSNIGSGSFRHVPTYWSKYCTFSPLHFLEEYTALDISVSFFLDKNCPITTHYDVLYNRAIEFTRGDLKHGSCGLGVGATISRQAQITFSVSDFFDDALFNSKLKQIRQYYHCKFDVETKYCFEDFEHDEEDHNLSEYRKTLKKFLLDKKIILVDEGDMFTTRKFETYIFEGAQGILLDIEWGEKPHITQSNTTSKNALEIISRNFDFNLIITEIFYVTRAYHTRHGAGKFRETPTDFRLMNSEKETNVFNLFQGHLRLSPLDIDLVNYSLKCDELYSKGIRKNIVITCLDQIPTAKLKIYKNDSLLDITPKELPSLFNCKFGKILFSYSDCAENLKSSEELT